MKTYTFHVSLPGFGRVWRKVELTADQTLEDLHFAIQNAYRWDSDHLYSFFMSGKAWDSSTEYCLPEDADPFDTLFGFDDTEEADDWDDELADDDIEPQIGEEEGARLLAALGDQPPPQTLQEMLSLVETNEELRAQVKKMMTEQLSIPAFMTDMLLSNIGSLMSMLPEGMFGDLAEDEFEDDLEPGDVRTTALESLDLQVGKQFMYLFDYGDEWRFKVRVHAVDENGDPKAAYPRIVESVGEAPPQYPDWEDEEEEEDDDDEELDGDLE